MRFPFRIITTRRLEQVEAVEQLNDLHFIRGAVEDAKRHIEDEIEDLKFGAALADGIVRDPLTLQAIDKLRTLRTNLMTVLFRVGRS